ncbi:MAG TPA: bilirubin oxidase [Flavobacteriales bacterium]|nr:bilirubin oxidase [Flavobacteriales bacterium]HIB76543.1 bilirubin oxidase [Flavobacteriales bacterium]HIO16386.1 bilirubin oxidase [Flavobacteriales bacterium]
MKKVILSLAGVIFFAASVLSQNQLAIPPTLSGTSFNLTLQQGITSILPGAATSTMGANGSILGPTLIFEKGTTVNIDVDNQLPEATTIHWHGMHLPSIMDGGPHSVIEPNTVWSPSFEIMNHASTMWYHPHLMHTTNKHVQMGIAGLIIIRDAEEAALNLPRTYGVDDIPLVLQTKTFTAANQIDTDMANSGADHVFLANATVDAFVDVPAQVVRLRLLNGASERSFNVGLSNGASFQVIASDGGLLAAPVTVNRLLITNGERYEILVNLSAMQGGSVNLMNYGAEIPSNIYGAASVGGMGGASIPHYDTNPLNGANFPMLTMNVGAPTAGAITSIPSTLANVTPYTTDGVNVNRSIVISGSGGGPQSLLTGPFVFNGAAFDINVINEVVQLGDKEVWTIVNQSMIFHPFHIHNIQFNILEINGNPPLPHQQGWNDVLLVPSFGGSVKFITQFNDFVDPVIPFMYHCHMLTHEDGGLMGQFTVEGTIVVPCPADVNGDGSITVADLLLVLSEFGCTSACTADVDGDGSVTVADVLVVLSLFGTTC